MKHPIRSLVLLAAAVAGLFSVHFVHVPDSPDATPIAVAALAATPAYAQAGHRYLLVGTVTGAPLWSVGDLASVTVADPDGGARVTVFAADAGPFPPPGTPVRLRVYARGTFRLGISGPTLLVKTSPGWT